MSKKYPLDNLIKALVLIDNEEDCKKLLDDICTIEELNKIQELKTGIVVTTVEAASQKMISKEQL